MHKKQKMNKKFGLCPTTNFWVEKNQPQNAQKLKKVGKLYRIYGAFHGAFSKIFGAFWRFLTRILALWPKKIWQPCLKIEASNIHKQRTPNLAIKTF